MFKMCNMIQLLGNFTFFIYLFIYFIYSLNQKNPSNKQIK